MTMFRPIAAIALAAVACIVAWVNRMPEAKLGDGVARPDAVEVLLAKDAPAARDWVQFFKCSGIDNSAIRLSTMERNPDSVLWQAGTRIEDVRVTLALDPGERADALGASEEDEARAALINQINEAVPLATCG